jgi:thiol-disulfide isomerase/thioredoxin
MSATTIDRVCLVGCMVSAAFAMNPALAHGQVAARPDAVPGIRPGTPAPGIDLKTLAGGRVKLSELRGHPVVITFWGTWCPPCRDEFPELAAAHRKYRDRGLEVIAVNQRDQELSERDVAAFVEEFAVDFTVALDLRGRSRRSYRLVALPTTVFVDAEGLMRTIHSGPISPAQLAAGLASILPAE